MKVVAIIQARMSSERLPGKVLMDLCGEPVLWHIVERALKSKRIDQVVVATSTDRTDDAVAQFADSHRIAIYRGSLENVLERYYETATKYRADVIVRLTGDNALIDPGLLDAGMDCFFKYGELDYLSYRAGLPLGMGMEIFTYQALEKFFLEATNGACLEHVTPYIYQNPDKFHVMKHGCIGRDYSHLRWTMDTEEDYELVARIYAALSDCGIFSYSDILREYGRHKDWLAVNAGVRQKQVLYPGEDGKDVV